MSVRIILNPDDQWCSGHLALMTVLPDLRVTKEGALKLHLLYGWHLSLVVGNSQLLMFYMFPISSISIDILSMHTEYPVLFPLCILVLDISMGSSLCLLVHSLALSISAGESKDDVTLCQDVLILEASLYCFFFNYCFSSLMTFSYPLQHKLLPCCS